MSRTALTYLIFSLFPLSYLTPVRFSLAYLTYLWNILAFSRDFHKVL